MYPSYYKVQQVTLQYYPPKQNVTVTDKSGRIGLQALLDITAKRFLESLPHNIQDKHLKLISKWGFDGTSTKANINRRWSLSKMTQVFL